MGFCHLHVHTEYSLLDGACRISEVCRAAKSMGMRSLAITDHGTMYGVVNFYNACKAQGLNPIIGCEVYVAKDSRFAKNDGLKDNPYHLVLLAENNEGYRNLMKIVSIGFLEGFYYRPRVDLETLARYSRGIIALTACPEGEVPSLLLQRRPKEARDSLGRYRDIFGKESVFIELQRNGVPGQDLLNEGLVELSKKNGVPLVATNDCHYLSKEDARYHDVLLAIQTATSINDPKRLRFPGDEFYLKSPAEMEKAFSDVPSALANTVFIEERCRVELDFSSIYLPEFPVPEGETAYSYLRQKAIAGLRERLAGRRDPEREIRLEYELSMIEKMGYSSYFLIVADFVSYAKSRGIAVGPGRGSAAGSLVAYSLGITNIDPVEHDLVFERFLNPERVTMPDIDIDFQDDRRDEVIEYVRQKYGKDRVAQIITFGTMAARAAVRDVGRALALPYSEVDRIAKLIPFQPGMTIERALEIVPDLKDAMKRPEVKNLIETALKLEGIPRHSSVHAAGVVIGKGPLWDYVPLAKTQDGAVVTQYPMENLEELGLLKMDFLGLRTLTVIEKTKNLVNEELREPVDLDKIPLNDPKTYEMLSRGESLGVFQLESSWVRDFLKELKPREFKDIVAAVALCRPGPMEQIPEFIRARFGTPRYLHPILEGVLKETYGVLVYQEQILKIASAVAGFSLGEADILRRAVGKKKRDLLVQMEEKFLRGATERGIPESTAREIYDLILKFANYGFNKNHAAPYALLAYQTAYLKARFTPQFMAALLSSVRGDQAKVGVYLEEAKRLGLKVLGPSVNRSKVEFSVEDGGIRYGLGGIKNVGDNLARTILEDRLRRGKFVSLEDLVFRVGSHHLTRKALESLIQSGACDEFGTRFSNLAEIDRVLNQRKRQSENQLSLFGEPLPCSSLPEGSSERPSDFAAAAQVQALFPYPEPLPLTDPKRAPGAGTQDFSDEGKSRASRKEVPLEVKLAWERELLGMYFSGHPLEKYREILRERTIPINELENVPDGSEVRVGGRVSSLKKVTTRAGEEMAFLTVEDEFGVIEAIIFPKLWQRARRFLSKEKVVIIEGNMEEQEEVRRILAKDVTEIDKLHKSVNPETI